VLQTQLDKLEVIVEPNGHTKLTHSK